MSLRFFVLLSLCTSYLAHAGFTKYNEYDPYPFVANATTCTSNSNSAASDAQVMNALKSRLRAQGIYTRLVTNRSELFKYAEDYGHIIHNLPFAAFVPSCAADISQFICTVNQLKQYNGYCIQIVPRGGSGNVQGATQALCSTTRQILLDLTYINTTVVTGNTAWVGAGASWLTFVQTVAASGLRPTVIPDYLGLTIGGTISVGGFGLDAPNYGPAIDQVLEIEVVTAQGLVTRVSPTNTLFKAVRGGMGVFAVITQVRFTLAPSPPLTTVINIVAANFSAFLKAMDIVITKIPSRIQGLEAFGIPNTRQNLEIFVAPASDLDKVNASVNAVLARNQTYIYYIELVVRSQDSSTVPTPAEIASFLPPGIDKKLIFYSNYTTPVWDNRLKLFTVPALVATGSWYAKKPWIVVAFPATSANIFNNYLQTTDPFLDLGYGLIAFYPSVAAKFRNDSFLVVPKTTPTFYLVTLGRTELTGTAANLQRQANGNRQLWDLLKNAGPSTNYASSYIPNFGPSDWQHSFGSKYNSFLSTKRQLDPQNLFGDQRNFGF